MGRKTGLAFLLGVSLALLLGSCRAALTLEGGPSTFGYDASSSCSKPISRTGRGRRLELPCDLSRENWCTIAGNTYPWHAVRRFVQENQGLMRRMYGDEKHISVLKTELEKNEVELEVEGEPGSLYYDDTNPLYRQFQLEVDYEFEQDSNAERENSLADRGQYGRSLNSGTSSKLDKPTAEELPPSKRHSHPNETPTVGTGAASATPSSTAAATTSSSPLTDSTAPTHGMKITAAASAPSTSAATASRAQPETTSTTSATSTTPASTAAPIVVSLEQIANVRNLSINEINHAGQIDRFDENVDELAEITDGMDTTPWHEPSAFAGPEDVKASPELVVEDAEASESQHQPQQFRPRPEYRPSELPRPETTTAGGTSMEGQLYQDVAAKDKQEPVLKVRGINACPVKEEVVAPFWANNTRGEVLALLNLYPFEQYVHWEKCTHENKQMYCRDGCRCEQQYRLHRLLAYDPNNECRGIFSDWFKFPSCCICRCYDLPLEFRVTSRSPRFVQQHRKLKVRAPRKPPRQRYN